MKAHEMRSQGHVRRTQEQLTVMPSPHDALAVKKLDESSGLVYKTSGEALCSHYLPMVGRE